MAKIYNFENDSDSIDCVIDCVTGLEVQINVKAEYEPGQSYKAKTMRDTFVQAYYPETLQDIRATVYVGIVAGQEKFLDLEIDKAQEAEIEQAIIKHINEGRR